MTSTPTNTPITPEHIGYRVRCPTCNAIGEIDDITDAGAVVIRHSATLWHVLPDGVKLSLQLYAPVKP